MVMMLADDTWKAIAALALVLIMIVVIYIEWRFLRRKRWARQKEVTVKDEAYNAILTTKAIASSLSRSGVRSLEAGRLIRKAEEAKAKGDSKAVMQHTDAAKEILMKEKLRQKKIGDIAKLPAKGESVPATPVDNTMEKFEKETPKNFMQAKFVIDDAERTIEKGKGEGRNMNEAVRLQAMSQKFFNAKDYDSALKFGLMAKKSAEGEAATASTPSAPVPVPVPPVTGTKTCASCGTTLKQDDIFCRKCGVKIAPKTCPSCGTQSKEGDTFCRKCGVALT